MFINSIFKNFDNLGIKYCHWKSNHFIKESFESRQDFDLLVAKLDRNAFQNILLDHGFKRRISTPDKQYPTMEDFIGMDPNKGTLFHFHVHYALVLGRKYDKNYRIPIETEVFNSVIRHQEYPINIIAPEYELMLLIIRIFLKSKIKLAFIRKNQTFVRKRIFPKNIAEEFQDLNNRADQEKFTTLITYIFPAAVSSFKILLEYFTNTINVYKFLKQRRILIHELRAHRIQIGEKHKIQKNMRQISIPNSMSGFESGGCTIAVIGVDGSGKTTMVDKVDKWLSWKLSVKHLYLGRVKRHEERHGRKYKNHVLQIINRLRLLFKKLQFRNGVTLMINLQWLYYAYTRYKKFIRGRRLANEGYIVFFERFPLLEFHNMKEPMDGPRLNPETFLGKIENNLYNKIDLPEVVIILDVSFDNVINRRQGQSEDVRNMLRNKIDAVTKLKSMDNDYYIINTEDGVENTLLELKNVIWNNV